MQYDILGAVIKSARIHKGLSQEQLAELIDCSPRHVMSIENEHKKPGYFGDYILLSENLIFQPIAYFIPNAVLYLTKNLNLLRNLHACFINVISTTYRLYSQPFRQQANPNVFGQISACQVLICPNHNTPNCLRLLTQSFAPCIYRYRQSFSATIAVLVM